MLRPNTSFSRPSARGFNTSPGSTSIWSNQVYAKVQQLPEPDNSPAEKDAHAKRIRNRALQSTLANNRTCSISHEDKTSVSTVKQGLSPIWFFLFFLVSCLSDMWSYNYSVLAKVIRKKMSTSRFVCTFTIFIYLLMYHSERVCYFSFLYTELILHEILITWAPKKRWLTMLVEQFYNFWQHINHFLAEDVRDAN